MKYRPLSLVLVILLAVMAHSAEPFQPHTDQKTLRVFIFAGQSNIVGSDSRANDIKRFPPFVGLEKPQ